MNATRELAQLGEAAEENDEFMKYFLKYRPLHNRQPQPQQQQQQPKKRPWYKPRRKMIQLPKSRSEESGTTSSSAGSGQQQTSPLQGLSGMLSDKMTFSSSATASRSALLYRKRMS